MVWNTWLIISLLILICYPTTEGRAWLTLPLRVAGISLLGITKMLMKSTLTMFMGTASTIILMKHWMKLRRSMYLKAAFWEIWWKTKENTTKNPHHTELHAYILMAWWITSTLTPNSTMQSMVWNGTDHAYLFFYSVWRDNWKVHHFSARFHVRIQIHSGPAIEVPRHSL